MANVFSEANFEDEVLKSDIPVLVDFWATWCGPCRMIAPIIDQLSTELAGKIKVGKVDVDANNGLAATYGVRTIPTLLIPVLVDFWATWCGPCRMIAPIIDQLSTELAGKIKVGKVDVDANNGLAATYGVRTIPTLLIIKDGEIMDTMVGASSKDAIMQRLRPFM